MPSDFLKFLEDNIILFDGAMGSLLAEKGLPMGTVPEKWNLEKGEIVAEIHKSYYDAGSDVVITNTLGGTEIKLGKGGLGNKVFEVNKKAAEIVNSVKPSGKFVCGDVGPTGDFFASPDEFDEKKYSEIFREQAHGLFEGGVDVFIVETMYDLLETISAVKGIRMVDSSIPVISSMTFNSTPRGFYTMMGVSVEKYVEEMEKLDVDIIGTNCTLDSYEMIPLAEKIKELTDRPVIIQPNAGQPVVEEGKVVYRVTPDDFAGDIEDILKIGVQIVGGCCGTNPEHIKKIRKLVDKHNN